MSEKLVIIGAGGHAKVILDIAQKCGFDILGFLDDNAIGEILGYSVLGKVSDCVKFDKDIRFFVAIGKNEIREKITETYNLKCATLIHPSAQIGIDVKIGSGTVVMANAVVNPSANIGKGCIINSSSIVEHDCEMGDYSHISPAAVLCGTVKIGKKVHIGGASVVKNNIKICSDVTVGIGAAVTKDITETGIYIGVPARKMVK